MAGALTLFLLLAVSLVLVRAAGVALRITGVQRPVARFQAISALTGAGYTTSEAEALMHHPTRRRILAFLMLTGHLGVVSLAATVILAIASTDGLTGVVLQITALLFVVATIYALAASSRLDDVMCDAIGQIMVRMNWITPQPETTLYVHSSGQVLAEYSVDENFSIDVGTSPVRILAVNTAPFEAEATTRLVLDLQAGDTVLCVGRQDSQDTFAHIIRGPRADL